MGVHAENVGYRIKVCRERLGLTQVQLGGIIGVHGSTFSPIEKGRYLPGSKMALALAKVFNISIDELMEDKETVMSAEALSAPFEKPVLQVSSEFSARVDGFPEKLPEGMEMTDEDVLKLLKKAAVKGALTYAHILHEVFEAKYKDCTALDPYSAYSEGQLSAMCYALDETYSVRKKDETDKFNLWLKKMTIASFRDD